MAIRTIMAISSSSRPNQYPAAVDAPNDKVDPQEATTENTLGCLYDNADALTVYPRGRFEDAQNGRITLREFAQDVARHVEQQLPRPRAPRAGY